MVDIITISIDDFRILNEAKVNGIINMNGNKIILKSQ